jgi:hypothetical protein
VSKRFRIWRVTARRAGWGKTTPNRPEYFAKGYDAFARADQLAREGYVVAVDVSDCTVGFEVA